MKEKKYRPEEYLEIIDNPPQIRIEDKPCGCQFWKSGVDGLYYRIKTCSNYPNCKGGLFEKVKKEHITVFGLKNQGKTVFTSELLQKCPECGSKNVERLSISDIPFKFKCNKCRYEYHLSILTFDNGTQIIKTKNFKIVTRFMKITDVTNNQKEESK